MYFKFFKPQDCVKSSAEGRRPFIQSFTKKRLRNFSADAFGYRKGSFPARWTAISSITAFVRCSSKNAAISAISSGRILPSPVRSGRAMRAISVNTLPGLMRCTRTPPSYTNAAMAEVSSLSYCCKNA